MSAVATHPGSSATEVSDFLVLNKAIISKSVNTLLNRDLLLLADGPRGSRPMYLTRTGVETHNAMLPVSMRGQEIILADLSRDDIDRLNHLPRGMLNKAREVQTPESEEQLSTSPGPQVLSDRAKMS